MAATHCIECGDPLDEGEIDADAERYRCTHCGAVQLWRADDAPPTRTAPESTAAGPVKQRVTRTELVPTARQARLRRGGETVLVQWWLEPGNKLLTLLGGLVFAALLSLLLMAVMQPLLVVLLLVLASPFIAYKVAQLAFDQTRLVCGVDELVVEHGPLPSLKRTPRLPWSSITGVRAEVRVQRRRPSGNGGGYGSVTTARHPTKRARHSLIAELEDGGQQFLIGSLPTRGDARYLAHELTTILRQRRA